MGIPSLLRSAFVRFSSHRQSSIASKPTGLLEQRNLSYHEQLLFPFSAFTRYLSLAAIANLRHEDVSTILGIDVRSRESEHIWVADSL